MTGIFGLLGVLIGGFLDYLFTAVLDRKRGNAEARVLTIYEYEKFCDQLRKYVAGFIEHKDLMEYYYNQYSERKSEIKAKQLIYLSKKQQKIVNEIDDHEWKMLVDKRISELFTQIQNAMKKLK